MRPCFTFRLAGRGLDQVPYRVGQSATFLCIQNKRPFIHGGEVGAWGTNPILFASCLTCCFPSFKLVFFFPDQTTTRTLSALTFPLSYVPKSATTIPLLRLSSSKFQFYLSVLICSLYPIYLLNAVFLILDVVTDLRGSRSKSAKYPKSDMEL